MPLLGLAGLTIFLLASYRRWQGVAERERFVLGLKKASRPKDMRPEISRLKDPTVIVVGRLALASSLLATFMRPLTSVTLCFPEGHKCCVAPLDTRIALGRPPDADDLLETAFVWS